ncbi:MAG: DUF2905 family protein [Flavobacteriaceae bacterium]|jgi:hypothetical protein
MAKLLLIVGGTVFLLGLVLYGIENLGINYQNPLDFKFEKGQTKFYFPLGSSLLVSLVFSLLFYLFTKLK